jgi:2-dehydro-3-deoxygalactonokinase
VRESIVEVCGIVDSSHDVDLIVAAGMLTSEVGLVTVPHASTPAGLCELADAVVVRTIPEVGEWPLHFVPGIRTPAGTGHDGWMCADLMRGEECETLGVLSRLNRLATQDEAQGELAFVWPGSHTKLVEVDRLGRITGSHTSLAGEFLQAIARHTLIAASLPSRFPESVDPDAAEAGARAVRDQGLERAAFLVRIAALEGAMNLDQRASFWVGAVVANDISHLERHPILAPSRPVWVGGREPLRQLYARWLQRSRAGAVTPLDDYLADYASALGALEVAASRIERSVIRHR